MQMASAEMYSHSSSESTRKCPFSATSRPSLSAILNASLYSIAVTASALYMSFLPIFRTFSSFAFSDLISLMSSCIVVGSSSRMTRSADANSFTKVWRRFAWCLPISASHSSIVLCPLPSMLTSACVGEIAASLGVITSISCWFELGAYAIRSAALDASSAPTRPYRLFAWSASRLAASATTLSFHLQSWGKSSTKPYVLKTSTDDSHPDRA
mmetsp:Transcript_19926/g.44975  ORF Transcript_19926/g.44975 Transcript_19926/m.44975 type:complete len:212 (-) Transcript_19926:981-1616(-)